MSNVGYATLSVIPSFKGFQGRLSAGVAAPMASAGKSSGRQFGDTAGKEAGDRFKSGFGAKLKGFAPLAGIAAGAGALAFFKDAIDGASDLSEAGTKLEAIYGDAAAQVQDYASTAADSLGQTRLQALDAAATFGTFGKAAGLAGGDLAGFSTELVSLSTDMASFYNTDVSTAIEAIGSGLRGEAEPLRQFGVLLDDATLREEALRQGLIETTKQALNPQQKVLAAHAVILQQTTDAQGDFERTGAGLANQQRKLVAQWEEMKTAVGQKLLPAMTAFVSFLSDDALPALGEVGGAAEDAVKSFNDLPGPVKASAAAFVALRFAASTGITASMGAGVANVSSAMQTLRLRTMLASDAFRAARTTTMTFNGNIGTVSRRVGVLSASMQGLRVGAAGAGSALRSGLGGAMSLLGGPWGLAFIGATAAVTHFWQENREAKQRIEDMTAALDKQTGALTDNSRELAFKSLQESGVIDLAKKWGIALDDLTDAALGNDVAQRRVNSAMESYFQASRPAGDVSAKNAQGYATLNTEAGKLRSVIGGQTDEVRRAQSAWRDHAEAMGDVEDSNADAEDSFVGLRDRIRDAREELRRLADEENKRREAATGAKRDQLAFVQTLKDAHAEAKKGKATLDENTKAGQANWEALLSVADGWNETKESARNTRKAYQDMRQDFINLSKDMGANDRKAQHLADTYLSVPESMKTEVTTPGMDKALADLDKLIARLKSARSLAIYVNSKQANDPRLNNPAYATGGYVSGAGTATSDSIVARLSNGEFVQRTAAVDYYGVDFMRRLNALQVPKMPGYASGGLVQKASTSGGGMTVNIGTVVAYDYKDLIHQVEARARRTSLDGVR